MKTSSNDLKSLPGQGGRKRWRDTALLAGLLVLVLIGLAGLAAATGWQETWAQFSKLGVGQVAVLMALSLVNYSFRGFRWHLFARRLGLNTSLVQNYRHFLGGFAMTVTPGRVGELVRMRWLKRETGWNFERTAPLVLVDRASDLAALGVILAVSLAFSTSGIAGGLPVVILAITGAFAATRPKILAGMATLGYRMIGRWHRLFARVRIAARSLGKFSDPDVMAFAAAVSAIGWVAEGLALYLLVTWLGADLSLAAAVAIFAFSMLAGGLTGAPGGVGGAEAAMVALLSLEGVPLEVSVPATAVFRLTTLWFAIVIGMAVFPAAERSSLRIRDVVEGN